jgi:cell division septal protein FtsQ
LKRHLTRKEKLRRTLITTFTVVLIGGVAYGLGWSNIFQVKAVSITGSAHINEINQALNAGGINLTLGQRMARIDVKAIGNVLGGVDWIESDEVSRNWISGRLSIKVQERSALASFLTSEGGIAYFDKNGAVFHSPVELPTLPPVILTKDDASYRQSAAQFIASLPADLIASFQGLTIYSPDHIVLASGISGSDIKINWGSAADLSLKVKVLRALLALPENSSAKLFDLSNPQAPTVR